MKLTPKDIFYMVLDIFVLIIGFAAPWYRFSVPMLNFDASTSLFLIPFRISNLIGFLENDVFSLLNVDSSPLIAGMRFFQVVSVLPSAIFILISIAFVFLFGKKDKKPFYLLSMIAMGVVLLTSVVGLIINNSIGQGIREALSSLDSLGLGAVSSNVFFVGFGAGFYLLVIAALVLLLAPVLIKQFGESLPPSVAAIAKDDDDTDSADSSKSENTSRSAGADWPTQSQDSHIKTFHQDNANLAARQAGTSPADEAEIASLIGDDNTVFSIRRLPFTIGRDIDQVDGLLAQSFVSRQHCRFDRQNGRLALMDLNSTHGTFINHEKMPPMEQFYVLSDDVITVGKIDMTLSIEPTADASSPTEHVPMTETSPQLDQGARDEELDDEITRFQVMEERGADAEDDDDELTMVQTVPESSSDKMPGPSDKAAPSAAGVEKNLPDASETLDDELTTFQTMSESSLDKASDKIAEDAGISSASAPARPASDEPDDEAESPADPSPLEAGASGDGEPAGGHSGESTFIINFADRRCLVCVTPGVDEAPCVITACPFRIGRNGDEVDYVIAAAGVSRSHLMITKDEKTYYATDLHAKNRVKINGNPISPGIEVPIEIGDVLTIGNREYRFEKV